MIRSDLHHPRNGVNELTVWMTMRRDHVALGEIAGKHLNSANMSVGINQGDTP